MHENEVAVDAGLVRRLLAAQRPEYSRLPLTPVPSAGTDNALFRLGDEYAIRLPRIDWAAGQPEKEARWLPELAPRLPLPIPLPVALGEPGEGYPWNWSVVRWLDGANATPERLGDPVQAARTLAGFVRALWAIDATGGPPPGAHNSGRGVALAERDGAVRTALAQLVGRIDVGAAEAAWERARATPVWDEAPVWVHGDLQSGNLLASEGRLSAVIDFGCLGVGDPAVDLLPAWNLFDGAAREAYREALGVDDATWERGRGWAVSVALIALPYYGETSPAIREASLRTLAAALG